MWNPEVDNECLHFSLYYAFRQGSSLSFKTTDWERISVLQGFSHLCLSSPGITGKYHQHKHLTQMLQMINTSLQVWIASTSWVESFAQPSLLILKWTKIILSAWVFIINCLAPFRMRGLLSPHCVVCLAIFLLSWCQKFCFFLVPFSCQVSS